MTNPAMEAALAAVGNLGDAQRKAMLSVAETDLCNFPIRNLRELWFSYAGATREPLLADRLPRYRERLRSGIRAYRALRGDGHPPVTLPVAEYRRAA